MEVLIFVIFIWYGVVEHRKAKMLQKIVSNTKNINRVLSVSVSRGEG
jgi:hypothetical protein